MIWSIKIVFTSNLMVGSITTLNNSFLFLNFVIIVDMQ